MEVEEATRQVSRYNDAMLSISRLHECWLRCNKFIRSGNFSRWKYELDMIWLELYPDVLKQKEDKDKIVKKDSERKIAISKSLSKTELFHNLMKRHEFLREIQDLAGKGGSYEDENREAFE